MNSMPFMIQFFPVTLFANVIFPAFMTPYITMLLFPVWGIWLLLSEWYVLVRLERQDGRHGRWQLFRYVVMANLVSSLCGIGLSLLLPSGLQPREYPQPAGRIVRIMEQSERWGWYAIGGFVLAYGLSIALEGFVLKHRQEYGISNSWKKACLLNSTSYGGILLLVVLMELFAS